MQMTNSAPSISMPFPTQAAVVEPLPARRMAAPLAVTARIASSETVSAEDYCTYMGELVGVEPRFEYSPTAHTPLWPDVTLMHEVFGRTQVPWRDGFRRMIEARYPAWLTSAK